MARGGVRTRTGGRSRGGRYPIRQSRHIHSSRTRMVAGRRVQRHAIVYETGYGHETSIAFLDLTVGERPFKLIEFDGYGQIEGIRSFKSRSAVLVARGTSDQGRPVSEARWPRMLIYNADTGRTIVKATLNNEVHYSSKALNVRMRRMN